MQIRVDVKLMLRADIAQIVAVAQAAGAHQSGAITTGQWWRANWLTFMMVQFYHQAENKSFTNT